MNTDQKIAAEHEGGPLLVIAGPGTGKTTTLVGRYQYLLSRGVTENQILCCTFSKKAADELKLRITSQTRCHGKGMFIGTFHSLALKILKSLGAKVGLKRDFDIWTNYRERIAVIEEIQKRDIISTYFTNLSLEEAQPTATLAYIDSVREELIDAEDASIRASELGRQAELAYCEVYREYEQYLATNNLVDFPRMVQLAVKALEQDALDNGSYTNKFQHILVDEFQDINAAQKRLVDLFVFGTASLWAVGDDYQAIYGWRGSDVRYMLDFKRSYKGAAIHALKVNYRSGQHILQAAENLSNHFLEGFKKTLTPNTKDTGEIYYDALINEADEAQTLLEEIQLRLDAGVSPDEIAVLSRTNKRPIRIATKLLQNNIPVDLKGGVLAFDNFYEKQLILAASVASGVFLNFKWPRIPKDLYGFSKRLETENWDRTVRSLITYVSKRLSGSDLDANKAKLEDLKSTLLSFTDANAFFSILKATLEPNSSVKKVFVGTIHSAKGLEWDSVFITGMEDGNLPQRQTTDPKVYDEERRIAYVAVTRAKSFLFFTSIEKKQNNTCEPSPFLAELFGTQQEKTQLKQQQEKFENPGQTQKYQTPVATTTLSREEQQKLARDKWKLYQERVISKKIEDQKVDSANAANGEGNALISWDTEGTAPGFLQEAGYTTRKDGPDASVRQGILKEVFLGLQDMPDWLSDSVTLQWGAPRSSERFNKIRSTINVGLGTQKGRQNPSIQAIKKWEEDLFFMDNELYALIAKL